MMQLCVPVCAYFILVPSAGRIPCSSCSLPVAIAHESCDDTTTKGSACMNVWCVFLRATGGCVNGNTGMLKEAFTKDKPVCVCVCVCDVYLLRCITVNHVRHERDLPVQEGGRSQVQWNLVCHHHCDVHSWRNSLNCPTWESTETLDVSSVQILAHTDSTAINGFFHVSHVEHRKLWHEVCINKENGRVVRERFVSDNTELGPVSFS